MTLDLRTSLTAEVEALASPATPRRRLTVSAAIEIGLRSSAVFCATTLSMLGLWILVPVVFLGWSATAIESGSMAPNLTRGDVVLLRPVDRHPLATGAVVRFRVAGSATSTVHRIERVDRSAQTYVTRGDANRSADSTPVSFDEVDGAGALLVPIMGFPLLWAQDGQLVPLGLLALGVVVVVGPGLHRRSADRPSSSSRLPIRPLTALGADPTPLGPPPLFPARWIPGGPDASS